VFVQALASFAVGATGALLVVLAEHHLRLPPAGFAWLIGAIGAGALVGPLIPNMLAKDYRTARWLFVPYIIRGIGDVLIAVFTSLPLALGGWMVDLVGIEPVFWLGGSLLALAGCLGLALLGNHDFQPAAQSTAR